MAHSDPDNGSLAAIVMFGPLALSSRNPPYSGLELVGPDGEGAEICGIAPDVSKFERDLTLTAGWIVAQ